MTAGKNTFLSFMRKRNFAAVCACVCGIITATAMSSVSASAGQPVETISPDPLKYCVKQGPAQCGPAAFYMVLKYYGDNLRQYPYFYDRDGLPVDLVLGSQKTGAGIDIVNEDDPVSAWIKGKDSSTDWKKLVAAARGLCYKNDQGMHARYYEVVDSYDSVTGTDSRGREIKKINFMEKVAPEFLDKNRPVIIHLKRKWPFPGHYVVVIGFDRAQQKVYFMDPNAGGAAPVGSVSLDDFLNEFWYKGNAPSFWGRARWSGKWLGFYRIVTERARTPAPEK